MRHIKQIGSLLAVFILIFQLVSSPLHVLAQTNSGEEQERAFVYVDDESEEATLFEDESDGNSILQTIESGIEVIILESNEDFSYIEFYEQQSSELANGYIENKYLISPKEMDNILEESSNSTEKSQTEESNHKVTEDHESDDPSNVDGDSETSNEENDSTNVEDDAEDDNDSVTEEDDAENNNDSVTEEDDAEDNNDWATDEDDAEDDSDSATDEDHAEDDSDSATDEDHAEDDSDAATDENEDGTDDKQESLKMTVAKQETLRVIGLRNPTNVRETNSTKSNVITSYPQGTIIELKTFSSNWYEVTVNVDGKETIGYIHHKHVDPIDDSSKTLEKVGLRNPTNIRKLASTKSKGESTYPKGAVIKVKSFSTDWYEVIDGSKTIGYVHHKHVGDIEEKQTSLKGIGINNPTNIRQHASTSSSILASLPVGSIIDLKTFTNNWYEASATVDGKTISGYVHHKHIGDIISSDSEEFQGIGINDPTRVRVRPNTEAPTLTTLPVGSIINLKSFSKHWYEATVKVNGKNVTGYIHKHHVGDKVDSSQSSFQGIGINDPTRVRVRPNTQSPTLKALPVGSIINLKTFSKHWYEATVSVNGKNVTGYVHKNHIGDQVESSQSDLYGVGAKNPTYIRVRPNTQADSAASVPKNTFIHLKTFSKHWYEASVTINGKNVTGYVHRNHVNTDKAIVSETNYNTDFNTALDIQMRGNPQVSGPNGGWVNATREQVAYYLNSSNFSITSSDYYQFLVLSQPAGLNPSEVNKKILNDHGVLTNKGAAFIEAANTFNINEAYLISHAKLETGNGSSALAKGVPVDKNGKIVSEKNAKHIVYNMYGVGAYDGCALECGAKKAFDEGWFTVDDAIIGGAEFIGSYIFRGQDTLYKMRWNPISPGYPQYATDIAWAVKQTSSIRQIYDLLDDYQLVYDVPVYKNQPASSGDPDKNVQTYIQVDTPSGLNIRDNAGTSYSSIGRVSNGTLLTPSLDSKGNVVTKNANGHVWYKIVYNKKDAWVSGGIGGTEFVNIITK